MHSIRTPVLVVICLLAPLFNAETVSTVQIAERTLYAVSSCLNWRWVGNCLWSDCDLLGCEVQTSMKVRHYIPDLLVTVQRSPADIPWNEMRRLGATQSAILSSAFGAQIAIPFAGAGGDVAVSTGLGRNGDVRFFEANVFGHPLEEIPFEIDKLFCKSVTKAGKPYYQSTLDALAWRFAPIESMRPEALVPGRREIGISRGISWGSIYPRSGFITQQSPAKAAAVVAQRACDIVIGPRGHHVALALESPEPYTTVPSYLNERESVTGLWQMISPKVDTSCDLLGVDDPNWDLGRIDESRAFIWNLWRPYECCERRGSTYLGTVDF